MQELRMRKPQPFAGGEPLEGILPIFPPPYGEELQQSCRGFAVEQIQLRRGRPLLLRSGRRTKSLETPLDSRTFETVLHRLMQGSPHAAEDLLRSGCLLYPGGYRVGVGGRAAALEGQVLSISRMDTLLVRIPGRHPGIALPLAHLFLRRDPNRRRGMLLCAPPGEGKTTVLRDLAELLSSPLGGFHTVVLDEREELFFGLPSEDLPSDLDLDVLSAWPKARGLEAAVRCLSPELLCCDELGDPEEAALLQRLGSGGVPLIATAHGCCAAEIAARPGVGELLREGLFFCCIRLCRGEENRLGFCYEELGGGF